ncbi:MAG TPA: TolC family protein [Vicinamibacterales bacterium]|nr:TolC family protein [Vicinamibacterales bacterium]
MNVRIRVGLVMLATLVSTAAAAQPPVSSSSTGHVDPVSGVSIEQAIARALEREPSLRAARSQIDVARGMREQSSLRPNPSVSFERREEPQGMDNQTMLSLEWPLDLFRRDTRVAVADRQISATEFAVANRQRMLIADVRARYGEVLTSLRDLRLLDDLVAATERQHDLLRARVDEGATAPLDRDLVAVELRRLESERLLQAGRVEIALIGLKRVLGMQPDATLMVRDTLEDVVLRESAAALPGPDVTNIVEQRADVRESAAQVEIAAAKIDRAEREGRLDVNLFTNYSRMNSGFPQLGIAPTGGLTPIRSVFHYVAAGAMVTVPLRNRNQGELAAARAEQTGAALTHRAALLTAETELAAARTRDDYARQAIKIYGSGAQGLARQNLTVVEQSFQLGRVTVFDVLTERRRYIEVERGYTDALRAAFEARTALNQAIGGAR